ncbi:uncharacterized protein LOC116141431 [Pistacia vera]|uniref:uncharacterized protein LOC116109787 n=1 Tax=Pistacia vera TaxID=55513 RepID=UPI001263625A|nr:uncharacterized protein LOC116109787 [Pistacia vera]XP_031282801.1 uncharacterized protein LOC116141431 [Pistacia vera]
MNSVETAQNAPETPRKPKLLLEANQNNDNNGSTDDVESVVDVSGKIVEFPLLETDGDEKPDNSVEGFYLYKNVFNLIPKSVGRFGKLKNLKFFGNEINLFPDEVGNLVGLECLQVKISSPGFNGLALNKLQGLKELELSKVPPRPSVLTLLSEIAGLKCLTKLSVCHFSIRFLPPEIGCLNSLEHLDLSFNKMKYLPTEISYLKALVSLKIANNKLLELPSGLSSLQSLENLDLSNNRLTSLGSLDLGSMHNLQNLNLQYNKLLSYCQVPAWICCNLEGNGKDSSNDDFISSSVEMDVYETVIQEIDGNVSDNGSNHPPSSILAVSNNRCYTPQRSSKRWKRQHYLQQRARQERLNNSRKWKGEGHAQALHVKAGENCKPVILDVFTPGRTERALEIIGLDDDGDNKQSLSAEAESDFLPNVENNKISSSKGSCEDSCLCVELEPIGEGREDECSTSDVTSIQNEAAKQDEVSSSDISKAASTIKRHSERDLDNPKPCKSRKSIEDSSNISQKYSNLSFCSIEDHLPDGFYDAGRDRPFKSLRSYEQTLHPDSREVILVDRKSDEELDAILLSAQTFVQHLKQMNGLAKDRVIEPVGNLQVASLLALFVSDHFGGSDRSDIVARTRRSVSGSNYRQPFVCTCSTGHSDSISPSSRQALDSGEDIAFADLCEKYLRSIKSRRNSIIVPLGTLQFGVCRHRALLLKYLCDRVEPPVPCELVRGYLDFQPHAWNTILVKRGDSWVRMVVDACHPHDIREETDPEYFCRYIPLCRTTVSLSTEGDPCPSPCSFPSLSTCDEIEKVTSSSLRQCKFGSLDAAAKVRNLELGGSSIEDIKNFEYSCLGEVRILGALKHSCIVEMYGHQICSRWLPSVDGNPERRVIQSAIFMEYVKGGSLKNYLEKLSKAGEKHAPLELALFIAQDVASALVELHSKHIMHRDIKSENVLIDLDRKKADGTPVVKLCDFDRAVPLRSFLHTCCIAHMGIPPTDVCVGTPRWMAPEVLQAMHKRNRYGLEVDIWSYGCILFELLTLQVPYFASSELEIHDLLQMGKRPRLTEELESLGSANEHTRAELGAGLEKPDSEVDILRFLVQLFRHCTEENPTDRPTARDLYETLIARTNKLIS